MDSNQNGCNIYRFFFWILTAIATVLAASSLKPLCLPTNSRFPRSEAPKHPTTIPTAAMQCATCSYSSHADISVCLAFLGFGSRCRFVVGLPGKKWLTGSANFKSFRPQAVETRWQERRHGKQAQRFRHSTFVATHHSDPDVFSARLFSGSRKMSYAAEIAWPRQAVDADGSGSSKLHVSAYVVCILPVSFSQDLKITRMLPGTFCRC